MRTAYVWIVVFFRSLAVCVGLYGFFSFFSGFALKLRKKGE